jgi:NADH-quinone oxidoreductase subunit M
MPLCILASWYSINYRVKLYFISFLLTEFFLLNIFCALDLFLFYIFFESILIQLFLIIGIWALESVEFMQHINFLFIPFLGR